MAKKSNKTSYVMNVIKNAGVREEDPEDIKPTWMTPGEFQDEMQDRFPIPSPGRADHGKRIEADLGSAVRQQMSPPAAPEADGQVSDLRKMLGGDESSDDPLSDRIRASLEDMLSDELAVSAASDTYDLQKGGYQMETKELNEMGTAFSFDKPDTVESDRISELIDTSITEDAGSSQVDTDGEYIFVNVAEELVRSKVPDIMKNENMCTCQRCVNDVVALTLNHISPKYVVTRKGLLYAKINACLPQYQAELLEAIGNACMAIKGNTRHAAPVADTEV